MSLINNTVNVSGTLHQNIDITQVNLHNVNVQFNLNVYPTTSPPFTSGEPTPPPTNSSNGPHPGKPATSVGNATLGSKTMDTFPPEASPCDNVESSERIDIPAVIPLPDVLSIGFNGSPAPRAESDVPQDQQDPQDRSAFAIQGGHVAEEPLIILPASDAPDLPIHNRRGSSNENEPPSPNSLPVHFASPRNPAASSSNGITESPAPRAQSDVQQIGPDTSMRSARPETFAEQLLRNLLARNTPNEPSEVMRRESDQLAVVVPTIIPVPGQPIPIDQSSNNRQASNDDDNHRPPPGTNVASSSILECQREHHN
ncbi:hypothetical protein CRE_11292 [Caenorhabditis remanei]|uniref:Uncharacterized protein n=1 Tax=Caenorhabditis remanei TaxID=31234 RepID=E3N0D5_CAERE|nr:hypothetical protein CRE_11292 [Caenorhabditis remanei]